MSSIDATEKDIQDSIGAIQAKINILVAEENKDTQSSLIKEIKLMVN